MNFFKSVFSDDPGGDPAAEPATDVVAAPSWTAFSGLIKTIVAKSEPLIETYRRDLEEFGAGLRDETVALREAILDIPTTIEAGAAAAQTSLESVGAALDELAADVITLGKNSLVLTEEDAIFSPNSPDRAASGRVTRLEAKIRAIQENSSSFTDDPDDLEEFGKWVFDLEVYEDEIRVLLEENRVLAGKFGDLVPEFVDGDVFWRRYFYRVYRVKQAEDIRAELVKRAMAGEEDEDLSWEVEDDELGDESEVTHKAKSLPENKEIKLEIRESVQGDMDSKISTVDVKLMKEINETEGMTKLGSVQGNVESNIKSGDVKLVTDAKENEELINMEIRESVQVNVESKIKENEEGIDLEIRESVEGDVESKESSKNSDFSIVSTQPSVPEEDDLGWDEIEDLGDSDEKIKVGGYEGSSNPVDLRKRLSSAEDEEDLSWDVEDDEPKRP